MRRLLAILLMVLAPVAATAADPRDDAELKVHAECLNSPAESAVCDRWREISKERQARRAREATARKGEEAAAAAQRERRRRERVVSMGLTAVQEQDLIERRLFIGATKEMAELAWAPLTRVSKTTTAAGTTETYRTPYGYLTFYDGRLAIIQQ